MQTGTQRALTERSSRIFGLILFIGKDTQPNWALTSVNQPLSDVIIVSRIFSKIQWKMPRVINFMKSKDEHIFTNVSVWISYYKFKLASCFGYYYHFDLVVLYPSTKLVLTNIITIIIRLQWFINPFQEFSSSPVGYKLEKLFTFLWRTFLLQ